MDQYEKVSFMVSKLVTEKYSTSFSASSRLFDGQIRADIYAIYGLVRIADEIVDTYRGSDAEDLLNRLESDVYAAIERDYDVNPIIHAFSKTAKKYHIDATLIAPFFESMAMDLRPAEYTKELYERYIYGSAEVVGLMCLKVFCGGDAIQYAALEPGARALGSAYQKINFLRDIKADYEELGRLYFPGIEYESFDEQSKSMVINDIVADLVVAKEYVGKLPHNSQKAVSLSLLYYEELLYKIKKTPAATLKRQRVRIADARKALLMGGVMVGLKKI